MMRIHFMLDRRNSRSFLAFISIFAICGCGESQSKVVRAALQGPGQVAMAIGNPPLESPVVTAPSGFKNLTYYRIMIQGINIGSAVIARSSAEKSQDVAFELKMTHRLGYAPLLSTIKFSGHQEDGALTRAKQNFSIRHFESPIFDDEAEWTKDSDETLKLTKGQPEFHLQSLGLRSSSGRVKAPVNGKSVRYVLPFFAAAKVSGTPDPMVLNPLSGKPLPMSELSLKFAPDGIADELQIPWFDSLSLRFVRDTAENIEKLPAEMTQTPLELAWFSTPVSIQDDLKNLHGIALAGSSFARSSEKQIRKEFPQLPYLFHRKLFNFNKLCERLSAELTAGVSKKRPPEQTLIQLGWVVRSIMSEDHRELPRSLVNSPELEVLSDDGKKWQWAKIITNMLNQTSEELSQVLAIEDSQKVNVAVRMASRNLARGSVVKGMLRSGRLVMKHQVESAGSQSLYSTSLLRLPSNLLNPVNVAMSGAGTPSARNQAAAQQTIKSQFEFINGQAFAKGQFPNLSPLCENFNGRVGLDLGNSRNELFSSSIVRGVWDESTRVQLIRQFARRASANSSCRDIVLRAPGELTSAAKSELESFRRDILQTEMEFQISVGSNRTVRLVPGSYELVISSLVNGNILGKREIIIPQGHENLVLNLQL
jgi:hypothetical protein